MSDRQVDLELVRGCQGIEAADVDLVDARFGCAIGEDSIKAVDAFVRVVGDHGLRSSPDLDVGHYARTTEPWDPGGGGDQDDPGQDPPPLVASES